ncbi:DUF4328 domain-containing protein [Nonomuraea sp. NPDC050691]|uniref:DUF4328 domain-containing protein n=1 Tax=Nonomuraea sp. NPDC050691 TaxID=3155661 RepID=UPI0033CBF57B
MDPATPAAGVRPVRGPALAAVVTLAVYALVRVVGSGLSLWRVTIIERMLVDSGSVRPLEVEVTNTLLLGAAYVKVGVFALAAVAFLAWLHRVRGNAEVLAPGPHRRARPWVILGWFVPLVNLWFPKQVVEDVWNASKPGAPVPSLPLARRSVLVWAWWNAFVISFWVLDVVTVLLWRSDLESLREMARVDVVGSVCWAGTGALAAYVVMKITRNQEARLDVLPQFIVNLPIK